MRRVSQVTEGPEIPFQVKLKKLYFRKCFLHILEQFDDNVKTRYEISIFTSSEQCTICKEIFEI